MPLPDIASEPEPVRPPGEDVSTSRLIFLVEALCAAVAATYVMTESVSVAVIVAATALLTVALKRRG